MTTITPNLGLKKPLGNEIFNRQAYNENLDLMDRNAAKKTDLDAHLADGVHQVLPIPSGTAFPSNSSEKPMLFFRTDEGKLYWFDGGGV